MNVDSSKNNGPKLFKKYLQYVKAVSDGNKDIAEEILHSVCDSSISRNEEIHYDSDFENQVHDALENAGLIVDTQIGVSGYKIDLAVYDKKSSKYILGIECDGAAFHSSKSARERDIYRQRYLESRGWNIIRIWSRNWWSNPQKEVDRVVNKVNEILKGNNKLVDNNIKKIDLTKLENTISEYKEDINTSDVVEDIVKPLFIKENIKFVDKRDKGGCLWVIGGEELKCLLDELEKSGVKFTFSKSGGKATGNRAAWYFKG